MVGWIVPGVVVCLFLFVYLPLALRTIRPTDRGLIERFGKYNRFGSHPDSSPGQNHSQEHNWHDEPNGSQ